jgi:integrase/recombinase XerD
MAKKQLDSKQLVILKALDEDKKTSKAYYKFMQSIKTTSTLKAYNYALDKFMILSKLKSYDNVIKLKTDDIQDLLESYVISLKNRSYQTVNLYVSGVELFFEMNKVLFHKRILRKLFPGNDKEPGGKLPYTTEEIERMLSVTTKLRTKAIIHYLASTGSRPAGIDDPVLRLKHIVDMPHGCKSVYIYEGSKQGYWAFLTPEASRSLDRYFRKRKINGETLTDESPVFSNMDNGRTLKDYLSKFSARQMIIDTVIRAGIERIKTGNRFDKAIIYGFRKRFNTILKINNDVNSNIAEKLMAHKRGLDGTYLQPTKEECFAEFIKAIPELTISSTERQKHKIETLEIEKTELEQQKHETEKLEDKVARQDQAIHTILKKLDKIESE